MSKLLDRMPFLEEETTVIVRGEVVRLRSNQIIIWVSLTRKQMNIPNPLAAPFPVILDTGFSHTLAIQERHLVDWGGLRPDSLALAGAIRDRGTRVPMRAANIWIHPNGAGARELAVGPVPHFVDAPRGIAVYPAGDFPRLPILGLRAIADNNLILAVNGRRREATLRTASRWWPF